MSIPIASHHMSVRSSGHEVTTPPVALSNTRHLDPTIASALVGSEASTTRAIGKCSDGLITTLQELSVFAPHIGYWGKGRLGSMKCGKHPNKVSLSSSLSSFDWLQGWNFLVLQSVFQLLLCTHHCGCNFLCCHELHDSRCNSSRAPVSLQLLGLCDTFSLKVLS